MASELIIDLNNSVGDSKPTSQQPENVTSIGAVPKTEHMVATETHQASLGKATEKMQSGSGEACSVGSGESEVKEEEKGQMSSQKKSREEEENDREFSDTIERLDSVLLEAGGDIVVLVSGGKTSKSVGEAAMPVSGGEITESLENSTASGGVITVLESRLEVQESVGKPTSKEEVQGPVGEARLQVSKKEAQESVEEATLLVSEEQTQASVGTVTLLLPEGEAQESQVEVTLPLLGAEAQEKITGSAIESTVPMLGGDTPKLVAVIIDEAMASMSGEVTPKSTGEGCNELVGLTMVTASVPVSEGGVTVGGTLGEAISTGEKPKQVPLVELPGSVGETTFLVSGGEFPETRLVTVVQVSATETQWQVPETSQKVAGEVSDESTSQVTSESDPNLLVDISMSENIPLTLAQASESWIDTLVKNIVREVTTDSTGPDVSPASDWQGTGVAAEREQVMSAVASGNSSITVQVCDEETPAQVSAAPAAESSVTPDLVTVPSREGTSDPGHPAACREKEWPPLICTGSEARADTDKQGHTETVSERETAPPAMKDWETVGEVVTPTPETPIEREIRLAMEREMVLRQERGITVHVGEPELVEVRRKMVAAESVVLPEKERKLAGAQMQREILLETQREQDLVEQGKVMGAYDRGDQQELQEKKMIFESMNTEPSDPPLKRRQSELQKSVSVDGPVVVVPLASNHVSPTSPAEVKKGPSYAEANGSNIIIIEHGSLLRRPVVSSPTPAEPLRSSPAEFRRSVPADLSFSQLNSGSSPVPNSESPATVPGSPFHVLHSPSPRTLLEREIEEVQQRERELRRQRTSIYGKDYSAEETSQNTSENRDDIESGVYQPERPAWGRLEVNWPPNKSSAVNGQQDQVSDSPRTRRQRSTLIQSWESGNPSPQDDE